MDEDKETLSIRLSLAHALAQLRDRAYDALLHYGVNYKQLPEYRDDAVLDEALKLPIRDGRSLLMTWMERVENAIRAAIRRKSFKVVD